MALNRMVIRELQRELARLDMERAALEARSIAIRRILSSSEPEEMQTSVSQPSVHKRSKMPSRKEASVRAILVDLIKKSPGITSREATALLTNRGFSGTRKTSLSDRVYHELYRMLRTGVLRRSGAGFAMALAENPIEPDSAASLS
jgi:hypothetical protein